MFAGVISDQPDSLTSSALKSGCLVSLYYSHWCCLCIYFRHWFWGAWCVSGGLRFGLQWVLQRSQCKFTRQYLSSNYMLRFHCVQYNILILIGYWISTDLTILNKQDIMKHIHHVLYINHTVAFKHHWKLHKELKSISEYLMFFYALTLITAMWHHNVKLPINPL